MKTILKGAVWVFVATMGAVVGFAVDQIWIQARTAATEPSDESNTGVHALGSIEPQGGIVEVALPPGLRPLRFHPKVVLNGWVDKDQELAYLDGYDDRQREIDVIDSEIKAAEDARKLEDENERAALEAIDFERRNSRQLGRMQVDGLDWKIKSLDKKSQFSLKQFENVKGLERNNTIPDQQYEQLRVEADISLDELNYARAERARAQKEIDLTTSDEAIDRQKRKVGLTAKRARSQYPLDTLLRKKDLARAAKQRCTVVAPVAGRVLEITTHEGENAAGRPLLKLGNTQHLYVLAEVYEDERKNVRVGQKAEIKGRGLPLDRDAALPGTVERISPMVGGHTQSPLDPTYRENSRVYEVWIRLHAEKPEEAKALEPIREFILQPVEVTIQANSGRPPKSVDEGRP